MAAANVVAILEFYRRAQQRIDVRVQQLLLYYARIEDQIIAEALAGLASASTISLRERRRREAFVRELIRVVDSAAQERVPVIINQAFQTGRNIYEKATDEKQRGLSKTNREAMTLLTENLIGDLGDATAMVGRRVEDIFRKESLRAALQNVPGERPQGFISDELQRTLRRQGISAFVDKSGRQWTLSNYTSMATKTVTNESINVAQGNIFTERGIDLVQINRSKNPCVECLEFNGNTYSLTGRAKGHPILKQRPPYHGNCAHIMFPDPDAIRERNESGWEALKLVGQAVA